MLDLAPIKAERSAVEEVGTTRGEQFTVNKREKAESQWQWGKNE